MDKQNQNPVIGGTVSQINDSPQAPSVKPRDKKKIIIGVAIGIAVVIIGMGVVFATGIWDPVWNPLRPSPDKIMKQALENMSKLDNVRTKIIFDIDVIDDSGGKARLTIDVLENASNPDNPKSKVLLDLSITKGGLEMLFGGEVRVVDKILYINITTVPIVMRIQLAAAGIDLDSFIGKWLKFDPKEAGLGLELMGTSDQENQELTNEILGLLEEYPIFKTKSKLPSEKINNSRTYHYLLNLDEKNTKKFVLELSNIIRTKLGSLVSEPMRSEEETKSELDQFFDEVGDIGFEIWIGKEDKYIYKIKTDKKVYALSADDAQTGETSVGFEMVFSEFNKAQEITAPETSYNLIELLMPFFQTWILGTGAIDSGVESCGG